MTGNHGHWRRELCHSRISAVVEGDPDAMQRVRCERTTAPRLKPLARSGVTGAKPQSHILRRGDQTAWDSNRQIRPRAI